jgi:hypothetical protein
MKRYLIIVFSLCLIQFAKGQTHKLTDEQINKSTAVKIEFVDTIRNCESIDEWFKADVKSNTVFIFLQGGIAPVRYQNDPAFEKKYNVYFEDFGDILPDYKCIIRYNENAFNHLTKLYGNNWLKEIRKNVIGLTNWTKKKLKK